MFPQTFRRFIWPQLLLIVAAALVVLLSAGFAVGHASADDAAFGRHIFPVLWAALIAIALACIASAALASRAAKLQIAETQQMLLDAVPAALARRPSLSQVDDQVLHDIAGTFSELMHEGTKDQAQLLTIISSMSDGLIATDHQQRILLTNDAAQELMDFRIPEARGKQLWEIVPIEEVLKTVTEVSLTGLRKTISLGPVSGKYLEVTICRLPLRPAGFIIVAHDVTETMRYEELRKEFVANVSHELRTPLSVIKGYVETLKDGALDDRERAIKFLGTIERHTDQLTNLVDDLLSLSRLDSTPGVPSPRAVHLGRVAHKVMELVQPAAEKKGHKLVLHVADGLNPVVGNPEYLERAVLNLVENSIKYTRENGLIKLIVRGEQRGENRGEHRGDSKMDGPVTIVEVIDNGIGIAADDLPRIFERFYRAERSRSRDMGGTGLGLSIVKHIVQAHGGTVEVQSAIGAGTTFRLKFPIASELGVEPASDAATGSASDGSVDSAAASHETDAGDAAA